MADRKKEIDDRDLTILLERQAIPYAMASR